MIGSPRAYLLHNRRDHVGVQLQLSDLNFLFKLPDEVCAIRRNRLEKIKQVDKICCCVLLTGTYLKKIDETDRPDWHLIWFLRFDSFCFYEFVHFCKKS